MPAHHSDEPIRDRRSESGAFDITIFLRVKPLKISEQFRNVFFFDADAGIGYGECQYDPIGLFALGIGIEIDAEINGAFARVFDCVGKNVRDDLSRARRIAEM